MFKVALFVMMDLVILEFVAYIYTRKSFQIGTLYQPDDKISMKDTGPGSSCKGCEDGDLLPFVLTA